MNSIDKKSIKMFFKYGSQFSLMSIAELKLFEDWRKHYKYKWLIVIHIGWWKYKINEESISFILKQVENLFFIFKQTV
jgi:hypothetical protein